MDENIFQLYPNYFIYNISIWSNLDPTASERMSGNDIFRDKNIVWQVRSVGPLLDNIWAGGNVKH